MLLGLTPSSFRQQTNNTQVVTGHWRDAFSGSGFFRLPAHLSHQSLGEASFRAEVSSSEQQSNKQWRRSVTKLTGIILQFNNGLGELQVRRQPDWQRGMAEGVWDIP